MIPERPIPQEAMSFKAEEQGAVEKKSEQPENEQETKYSSHPAAELTPSEEREKEKVLAKVRQGLFLLRFHHQGIGCVVTAGCEQTKKPQPDNDIRSG